MDGVGCYIVFTNYSLWMVLVVIVEYSLTSPSDTFTVDGVGCYIVFI